MIIEREYTKNIPFVDSFYGIFISNFSFDFVSCFTFFDFSFFCVPRQNNGKKFLPKKKHKTRTATHIIMFLIAFSFLCCICCTTRKIEASINKTKTVHNVLIPFHCLRLKTRPESKEKKNSFFGVLGSAQDLMERNSNGSQRKEEANTFVKCLQKEKTENSFLCNFFLIVVAKTEKKKINFNLFAYISMANLVFKSRRHF
jgi:hypothetical protein